MNPNNENITKSLKIHFCVNSLEEQQYKKIENVIYEPMKYNIILKRDFSDYLIHVF